MPAIVGRAWLVGGVVGGGGVGAVTTDVAAETAELDPLGPVALTATRIVLPASVVVNR
jgi:hypothetical protein